MVIEKYNNIKAFPTSFITDLKESQKSLFSKLQWFDLLQKHIAHESHEIIYYCVVDKAKALQSIFPLIKTYSKKGGYKLSSLANYYTMEYEPYFSGKDRVCQKAIAAFIKYLATEENTWSTLSFSPLDGGKLSNIYLREELSKYFKVTQLAHHKNWTYKNNGETFKEYLNHSPSRIKDIERKERRLVKDHKVTFKIHVDETDIEKYTQDYLEVYNNSWKNQEPYKGFIPNLLKLCAREGLLRLGIIYIDSKPAAVQFNIFHNKTCLIYKLSYHEKYKNLSAGAILSFKMMQYAFDQDHAESIDYGSGDDAYKKEWMSHCREKITLTTYNNDKSTKILYLKQIWKARLKQFILPDGL